MTLGMQMGECGMKLEWEEHGIEGMEATSRGEEEEIESRRTGNKAFWNSREFLVLISVLGST